MKKLNNILCDSFCDNIVEELYDIHLWKIFKDGINICFSFDKGNIPFDKQDFVFRSFLNQSAYHVLQTSKRALHEHHKIQFSGFSLSQNQWLNITKLNDAEEQVSSSSELLFFLEDTSIEINEKNEDFKKGSCVYLSEDKYKFISKDCFILKITFSFNIALESND